MDTEVRKRREILLIDGVPHAQFRRDAPVEVAEDVESVGALGCRGEPKELAGLQVLKNGLIRLSRGVVELIDDHDVEVLRVDGLDARGIETLN